MKSRSTRIRWFAALIVGLALAACSTDAAKTDRSKPLSLIPQPAVVQRTPGVFVLREGTPLIVQSNNAQALRTARYFSDLTARTLGLHFDLRPFGDASRTDAVTFILDPAFLVKNDRLDEGYELSVGQRGIRIVARTPRGLFHGGVTLWQLLTDSGTSLPLQVPQVAISDYPRFAWRGSMLDSVRHFQSPEFVKRFIDELALHKINVFQWHLTDDQGWRIQIKKYPQLTQIGAWRAPPGKTPDPSNRYGGFYTQDEIRDIVRYAAERYITIIPEIEMPGHAQAAIAAYPNLGVTGAQPSVSSDWGVHTYLYNVDDSTFGFLEDVLTDVMDLFPSTYIHIGGDEAAKDHWQASPKIQQRMRELGIKDEAALQGYFTARIGKFLAEHGRKLVGWDEILDGGIPPSATVMSWRGAQGAIDAAKAGHDTVMAPSPATYFDHLQSDSSDEPTGRPDVVSLNDVYAFDPIPPQLDATQAEHVLGAQANLWSEYLTSPQRIEHAAFPRMSALAEVLWSPKEHRDWDDFSGRMIGQRARYRLLGIDASEASIKIDASSNPYQRRSDALTSCGEGLSLRIAGDADAADGKPIYRVDLLNRCWVWKQADLRNIATIRVRSGHIPYYFQLWHDAAKVATWPSTSGVAELQLHAGDCKTATIASTPLKTDSAESETFDLTLPKFDGRQDLCLNFAGVGNEPFWLIDSVELIRR